MRTLALVLLCLPAAGQPRLLLAPDDFSRIRDLAASQSWAGAARDGILSVAKNWPRSHLDRFGLTELALPPEGGQWPHWYVCPVHGNGLQFKAPNTHTCPVDGKKYSGWPYDQVIFYQRHNDLATAARDNGLAYQLAGDPAYAANAAWILKQYAARYSTYTLHDVNNRNTQSGARANAQTLDEAVWLLPLVWAYDLVADTLAPSDRAAIESGLLRAAAAVIQRNDAGASNWQSWHNAAIGAVGFATGDQTLSRAAIDGKSGFRFQMANSVIDEGFWFEGAWSYHFYALDPLTQLADMAARAGIDLWSDPRLVSLYSTPLKLTFADGSLPAFNDSGTLDLFSRAPLYEHAFAQTGRAEFAAVAAQRARGRDALLFGAASLPSSERPSPVSEVFPSAGYAVLRTPASDHAVIVKFGPHGGGHGHYDKLGLVSFAFGGALAIDPGTQPYAAPTHETWDKLTVAHNTVVADETTQSAATGAGVWQDLADGYSAVRAQAGPAYSFATLDRTLLVTPEYALDLYRADSSDGKPHRFDWVYHNGGTVQTGLALEAYDGFGKSNGYQNLTGSRAAATGDGWQLTFDGTPSQPVNYGSVYASSAAVQGTFQYSSEQARSGRFSGRMQYQFHGAGYLLFSTPLLAGQPDEVPTSLRMWVYGDGSGHILTLRINDATDERFTFRYGPVDWTGWKLVEAPNPASWTSHYLGNNDGIIDTPIRTVSLQLDPVSGGPESGSVFVDHIALAYGDREVVAASFDLPVRCVRVWMLGADGTTVVTGNGLGPDLKPLPYVMARRQSLSAEFVTLLEPYRDAPRVQSFSRDVNGTIVIRGADFEDRIRFTDSRPIYERSRLPGG